MAPKPTTGSLAVLVSAAAQGSGAVSITGPGGYRQRITSSTTLSTLAPGSYTIATDTTQRLQDSIVGFRALVGTVNGMGATGSVTVTAGDTARAAVAFGVHRFGGLVVGGSDSNEVLEVMPGQLSASGSITPAADIDSVVAHPAAVALDGGGNLWVVSYDGNSIAMFTAAQRATARGRVAPAVLITGLQHPWGIAVDGSGTVWVANQLNNTVVGYTASQVAVSGSPTPTVVLSDTTVAQAYLNSPSGLAFDAAGNLWVANNGGFIDEIPRAQLAASGAVKPAVVDSNPMVQPSALAFDAAGNLWVTGYNPPSFVIEYAQQQLATSEVTPAVTLTMSALGPSARLWGIAFDRRGYLWTVSTRALAAYAFSPAQLAASGSPTPTTTLTITSPAHGTGAQGVLLDPFVLLQ